MALTESQIVERRKHIGASDAPAIVLDSSGRPFSPFPDHNPMSVYLQKVFDAREPETEAMARGTWLEPAIVSWAAERLGGVSVATDPASTFHIEREKTNGVLAANLDALIIGKVDGARAAIEAKFVGAMLAPRWGTDDFSDGIPDYVNLQVQQQMACADLDVVFVAAVVTTQWGLDRRMFKVPRSQALIDAIIEVELAFWRDHILAKVPPENFLPSLGLLKSMERQAGAVIDLGDPSAVVEWEELRKLRIETEKREEAALAVVLSRMGDAEAARFADGSLLSVKLQNGADVIDRDALRAAGLYEQFARKNQFRVPRLKRPK